MTTAQDGGKVVSVTHRPPLHPQEMLLVLISVKSWVDPRAIVRSKGFYVNERFQWYYLKLNQRPFSSKNVSKIGSLQTNFVVHQNHFDIFRTLTKFYILILPEFERNSHIISHSSVKKEQSFTFWFYQNLKEIIILSPIQVWKRNNFST